MASNATGLNVSTGIGDGSANVLQWGHTDQALNRLYQEQLLRKQQAQRNYEAQQLQFQKELGAIRSADIPDAVNAYNNRKVLSQQILFDKKLQRDPVAYAQAQLKLKQADADYYGVINGSKETMDFDKSTSEDMSRNHDLYDDAAHNSLMQWQQMPTTARRQQGLLTTEPLLYKGTNTDFGKILTDAKGKETEYPVGKETLTPDRQYYTTQYYKRSADPMEFKNNIIGQLAKKQSGRDATIALGKITPQEFENVNKAYDAINPEQYKKLYGKDKPNLDPTNPNNPADVWASFQAKQYAVSTPPTASKTEKRPNQEYAFENQKKLIALRHAYDKDLLAQREKYKKASKTERDGLLEGIIKQQEEAAKKGGTYSYKKKDGTIIKENQINAAPLTKKALAVNGTYPDAVRIMPNGDVHAVFYQYNKGSDGKYTTPVIVNGKAAVDEALTYVMPRSEYKIALGKELLSDKQLADELYEDYGDETTSPATTEESEIGFKWVQ